MVKTQFQVVISGKKIDIDVGQEPTMVDVFLEQEVLTFWGKEKKKEKRDLEININLVSF